MQRRQFMSASLGGAIAFSPLGQALAAIGSAALPEQLPAIRLDGSATTLTRAELKDFQASLRGTVLVPGADGYDVARRVWNGMIDRRPALIARCSGAADVARAVQFAGSNDLLVAVRGGGHSTSGQSVCDGGLMIDLSTMRHVRVDPKARRAWVSGGALLGDLDAEAQHFGLATTAGTVSHTGAAGLTLGGGFGRLGRRFGLTCDNVLGIDLVTADGQLRRAGAGGDRDLLWGLRGGGGNFGVATGFEYELHPVGPMVIAGPIIHPFAKARELLQFFAEYAPIAPDDVNVDLAIVAPPGAKPMAALEVVYSGDPRRAEKALATVRGFGKPLLDGVKSTPYLKVQRGGDEANAAGRQYYIKSGFVKEVRPELLDAIVGSFQPDPGRATVLLLQQLGGAIGRIRNTDTAFPHREAVFDLLGLAGWDDPAQNERHIGWVKSFWSAVGGYTSGYYFNTEVGDDQAKVRANFGVNYPRLVKLKNRVDPANRFRLNANVEPALP